MAGVGCARPCWPRRVDEQDVEGFVLGNGVRFRFLLVLVLLFSVVAVAVLWGQGLRSQAALREQVLQQSEQRSLHLADAMAGQVGSVFSAMDLVLHDLRQRWVDAPERFSPVADDLLKALPAGFVSHVLVVNAQGHLVFNSLGKGEGLFIGDRAFFRDISNGVDRMVIGAPVLGRVTEHWQFAVGRPILREGRFAGAIFMMVPTDVLAQRLAALHLSAMDVVALVQDDGTHLARSRDNAVAMGQRVEATRPFMVDTALGKGSYRAVCSLDQVSRTYGWFRLPVGGAVMLVGLADESVLGPLEPALRRGQLFTALMSLLLLAGGATIAGLLWSVERGRQAVGASEVRLKEAQHMARVGNWDLDVASGRLLWSDEVFRIFDLSPGEGSPTLDTFLQMVHPEDSERVREALRVVCSVRHTVQLEHRLLLPSGAIKHVRVMALNVFEGDRSVHSKGTIQDITETRRAELALQQLNEELEKRVSERTREMAVLNRELDTFSYSVSHDLRTPLRAIDGFASLLAEQSDRLSDEGRVFLHKIQESTRRMGELITDLLSLAHHGRAPVRHEKVNLSELARGLAAELERGESTRQIEWAIEDDLLVEADPTLMRVVLQNLLGNACKYTGREPRARISLSRSEAADGLQTFCVRDNGAGFDMAYASQLFQPFKRLHGRNEFEGTGVGLATVQRVVQRHGGKVSAEGVVGQGAAFYFSLPKEAPEAAPQSTW